MKQMLATRLPHGYVLPPSFVGFPEAYLGNDGFVDRDQFVSCEPGIGLVVNDIYHPENKGWRITARSIGLLNDGRTD